MARIRLLFITVVLMVACFHADAKPSEAIVRKILSQGVPSQALGQMLTFLDENRGRSFQQDTYSCDGQDRDSAKPCEESKRSRSSKRVTLGTPQYVAIVDYSAPSTKRRFFLINLKTGEVNAYYTAHGVGSGKGNYAVRFSNKKDSRQTSLGMYLTGEVYQGSYGKALRMYGLENSNDQAYNRDIVLHGAWYVGEDFINMINPKTNEPFGRLGLSWGCPAVSLSVIEKILPILKGGSLILHYHKDLQVQSLSGQEVSVDNAPSASAPEKLGEQGE